MAKKLFVGGLSWNITQDDLFTKFEGFGKLEDARLIMDRDTGRSRGFGFITFENDDEADKAMEELDGSTWDGRTIKVNEAQERSPRGGGGGGGGNRGPRGGGGGRGGGGNGNQRFRRSQRAHERWS